MAPIQSSDPTMPNPSTRNPLSTHSLDPVLSLDSWVGPTPSLGPALLGRVTWHSSDIYFRARGHGAGHCFSTMPLQSWYIRMYTHDITSLQSTNRTRSLVQNGALKPVRKGL